MVKHSGWIFTRFLILTSFYDQIKLKINLYISTVFKTEYKIILLR